MEGHRFDRLLRSLSRSPSRRGALRLLAGLVLGIRLAFGVAGSDAHDKKDKCKKRDDKDEKKRCRKKARKHNAAHNRPACVPQDPAAVCAAGCGTRPNNCGQLVTCPCPAGRDCLSNGSCAQTCDPNGPDPCPATCGCSLSTPEGQNHCRPSLFTCDQVPQSCTATAQCPLGQHCQLTGCGAGGTFVNRCVPLCTA